MPQMNPMPWLTLLFVVLALILLFSMIVYFYKLEAPKKSTTKEILTQEGWEW